MDKSFAKPSGALPWCRTGAAAQVRKRLWMRGSENTWCNIAAQIWPFFSFAKKSYFCHDKLLRMNQPVTYSKTFLPDTLAEIFTFSAKEKDAETGFSYFGSRYYSSDLSIWLSVDPQASKYPSLSPYTYCANNPIKLVDPNGEEIYVGDYIYNNGALYTKDGNVFKPDKGSFEEKALNSLNTLRNTKQGSELMSPFEGDTGKDIVVKDASNNPHTPGKVEVNDEVFSQDVFKSATIYWNPQGEQLFKSLEPNPTTDLGHEFSHAYDKATGAEYPTDNYDHCPRNEWQAVYRENMIRGEIGVPYRKGYRVFLYNKNDGTKKPYITKMLSSSGFPFLP